MKLVAFTETVADLRVRYQVLHMDSSAFVWAHVVGSGPSPGSGSLSSLALAVPARRGTPATPSATVVMPGPGAGASRALAEKLTRRTGLVIHAHVTLPPDAGPLADRVAMRLAEELQRETTGNSAVAAGSGTRGASA